MFNCIVGESITCILSSNKSFLNLSFFHDESNLEFFVKILSKAWLVPDNTCEK